MLAEQIKRIYSFFPYAVEIFLGLIDCWFVFKIKNYDVETKEDVSRSLFFVFLFSTKNHLSPTFLSYPVDRRKSTLTLTLIWNCKLETR
jgi:hypothetical protein